MGKLERVHFPKRMGSVNGPAICVALGVIGLLGVILCSALPLWKVSQGRHEGLWVDCVKKDSMHQCKVYESKVSPDLQAAQIMIIISCMLGALSVLVLSCGANLTTCVQNQDAMPRMRLVAGVGLLLGGLLVIIPVSWSARVAVTGKESQKREMGASIYIGWAAGVLMILAGGLLCWFNRPKSKA
uniref:Claudin n=2 Tax=Fundulus heteroclitus TaxID=8078 RepID=A0A3Q2U3B5_FUNHE